MEEKIAIRGLIRFFWKKGLSARATAAEICDVEGKGTIGHATVSIWFKRFDSGDMSLKDKLRSGRPQMLEPEVLCKAVEANPQISTRKLSDELGFSKSSIYRHLILLGKVNRSCRIIPHDLTLAQAQCRLEVCRKLLANPQDDRFFKRIVTCDEKWIMYSNSDLRKQWLNPGELAQPVVKQKRFEQKVMLCVWWNYEGLLHFELIPNGQSITADLYSKQLEKVYAILVKRYPSLINRRQVLLQQDNARPHVARITRQKIEELDGIELLPHPAYSPDLAPSDYYLFRSMAHFLQGRRFNNIQEVEIGVREFFASKETSWYRRGILELSERWQKTIDHNGLYFEY